MQKIITYFLLVGIFFSGCVSESFVRTPDGVKLAYEYEVIEGSKGTIVLLHGLGSNLEGWYYFKKYLHEEGWSTLALDFRGHGLSREWNGEELDWTTFNETAMGSSIHDIETAVGLISDKQNIWLLGSSFGANMALTYAAQHEFIRGVVLLSPGLNYAGVETSLPMQAFQGRPIMIAASEADKYSASSVGILSKVAAEPKKIVIFEGADAHGRPMLESVENLKEDVLKWINQNTALK